MGILRVDGDGILTIPDALAQLTARGVSCELLDLSSFKAELVPNDGPFELCADQGELTV